MTIYLVRHTSVNVPAGVCYGQTDVALKETFEEEARIVKANLKKIQPDIVFSSPLSRCVRLAGFCGFGPAVWDDRLKELDFGNWEGRKWDEIDMSSWDTDWINPPAPNGESFVQMYERVASFFDELENGTYSTVFIFTHGGVINCARIYFKQMDISIAFKFIPAYGEIVKFEGVLRSELPVLYPHSS